jgi:phosphoglycerate dehydrogenase-like enzyme
VNLATGPPRGKAIPAARPEAPHVSPLRCALWHDAAMPALHVLEYVRDPDGFWNLPARCRERLEREFPDVRFESPPDRAAADRAVAGADVVLGWAVNAGNLARAERLRWIHLTAAGVASYLFPALIESPVVVTNARGLHAASMSEHALAMMLALARKLHLARDAQRERRWTQDEQFGDRQPPFAQLEGGTLGIVGFGAVGRALAVRARALGMRVLVVRRRPDAAPGPADAQWGRERLPELLERSDWVVLVAASTAETHRLVGRAELARMKPGAVLINLGRGALVDEAALVEALIAGRIAGAALDVFEREPLPPGSPLWTLPQVLITPHTSGLGPRFWERTCELFARNLRRFRAGEPLENVVDKRAGY